MSVKIHFDPQPKRSLSISNASVIRNEIIRYGFREHTIPVKNIPIQSLIYRMGNGRTRVAQLEYLMAHPDLPTDFFKNNQENHIQQELQHEFLLTASKNPTKNIFKQLSANPSNIDELLITSNGVVINGNRRLSAMRELMLLDPKKYAHFSTVTVSILDANVTEDDICEIEDVIQIKKDMKLEYGWIDTLITFKDRLTRCNGDTTKINNLLKNWDITEKIKKENQDLLNLVDSVRAVSDGPAIDYSKLSNSEQNFRELLKINQRLSHSEDRQKVANINALAATIISNSDSYGDRSYSVMKKIPIIYDILCEEKVHSIDPAIGDAKLLPKSDSLNFTGVDLTINDIHNQIYSDIAKSSEIQLAALVKEKFDEVVEKEYQENKKSQPRETLKEIHDKLCNIIWEDLSPELNDQVLKLLKNIEVKIVAAKTKFEE